MFERYNESARRTLFFARFELTENGGTTIEPAHILLGLLRCYASGMISRLFEHWNVPAVNLRSELVERVKRDVKVRMSIEAPFTEAAKRVLNFAAEEADRLLAREIEPAHLLLGVLRENDSVAAASLNRCGMTLENARLFFAQSATKQPTSGTTLTQALADHHLDRITNLLPELSNAEPGSDKARQLLEQVLDELMALRELLR